MIRYLLQVVLSRKSVENKLQRNKSKLGDQVVNCIGSPGREKQKDDWNISKDKDKFFMRKISSRNRQNLIIDRREWWEREWGRWMTQRWHQLEVSHKLPPPYLSIFKCLYPRTLSFYQHRWTKCVFKVCLHLWTRALSPFLIKKLLLNFSCITNFPLSTGSSKKYVLLSHNKNKDATTPLATILIITNSPPIVSHQALPPHSQGPCQPVWPWPPDCWSLWSLLRCTLVDLINKNWHSWSFPPTWNTVFI